MSNGLNGDSGPDDRCRTPRSEVRFDDLRPAVHVVEAVADASDVQPTEVTPRLCDVVEPDALDRLFRPRSNDVERSSGAVRFAMGEWDVIVDWADERVRVYDADRT